MSILLVFIWNALICSASGSIEVNVEFNTSDDYTITCVTNLQSPRIIGNPTGKTKLYYEFDNAMYTDYESYPLYPFSCQLILHPNGSEVEMNIDSISWRFERTGDLALAEDLIRNSNITPYNPDYPPFWRSGVFLGETVHSSKFSITPVFLFPLQYDTITKEIYSLEYSNISININNMSRMTLDSNDRYTLRSVCCNYSAIEEYIDEQDSGFEDYLVIYSYDDEATLAVPPPNMTDYRDALMPLMEYREELGSNIYWAYLSPDVRSSQSVQNIINYYTSTYNIGFIILLGDDTKVPTNSFIYHNELVKSDNYYVDWLIGPVIARIPGSPDEIEYLVEKILVYEEYFTSAGRNMLCNNVVLMAHEEPGHKASCENIAGFDYECNDLDFIKYYREDGPIEGSEIRATINSGVGVVSYFGHGNVSQYSWDVPTFFSSTHVSYLNNEYAPISLLIACHMGYYISGSIAEVWLFDQDGGASSVFASTDLTYTTAVKITHMQLFKNIFYYSEDTPPYIGNATKLALSYTMIAYPSWTSTMNYYRLTLFGDPGQRVWTEASALSHINSNGMDSEHNEATEFPMIDGSESLWIDPNVFCSSSTIQLSAIENCYMDISVYDMAGRRLERVFSGYIQEGAHIFNWDSTHYPDGIYVIRLADQNENSITKTVLVSN